MTRALVLLLAIAALLSCGAWSYGMSTYSGSDTFEASFTLPDDSAPPTAAQVNPALEALGDRTKWAYERFAQNLIVATELAFELDDGTGTSAVGNVAGSTSSYADMVVPIVSVAVEAGDVVITRIYAALKVVTNNTIDTYAIRFADNVNGAGYNPMTVPTPIPVVATRDAPSEYLILPFSAVARNVIPTGGTGTYLVKVQGKGSPGGGASAQFFGSFTATVTVLRQYY